MTPSVTTMTQTVLEESGPRRALLAKLASFRLELESDPTDHTPLTEQLHLWRSGFKEALDRHEDVERVRRAFLSSLLHEVQMPEGPHRMRAPIAAFLRWNGIAVPEDPVVAEAAQGPTPEQARQAARIAALRARQQRFAPAAAAAPAPAAIEPNFALVQRIAEVGEEMREVAERIAAVDERMRADAAALRQQVDQLNQVEIPALRQEVVVLQADQRATGAQLVQVRQEMDQLERDIAETNRALREKREESLGSIVVALATVAASFAINAMLPGSGSGLSLLFTPNGASVAYTA